MSAKNSAISLFRQELRAAHELLEATLGDVTREQVQWLPPGIANPLGATCAHIVVSEDGTVNGLLRGGFPLFASAWADKTGLSELPPMPDPKAPGFPNWSAWGRRVKVDRAALKKYAQAVYTSSDEYLATLTDEDLSRPVSLSALGLGESTVGYILINGLLMNAFSHAGEIACLKGLQARRGYPV